jgi:hypothetical protein
MSGGGNVGAAEKSVLEQLAQDTETAARNSSGAKAGRIYLKVGDNAAISTTGQESERSSLKAIRGALTKQFQANEALESPMLDTYTAFRQLVITAKEKSFWAGVARLFTRKTAAQQADEFLEPLKQQIYGKNFQSASQFFEELSQHTEKPTTHALAIRESSEEGVPEAPSMEAVAQVADSALSQPAPFAHFWGQYESRMTPKERQMMKDDYRHLIEKFYTGADGVFLAQEFGKDFEDIQDSLLSSAGKTKGEHPTRAVDRDIKRNETMLRYSLSNNDFYLCPMGNINDFNPEKPIANLEELRAFLQHWWKS